MTGRTRSEGRRRRLKKVMIDPGHAPGNPNGGKNGYLEYAGMWRLSNNLREFLISCDIDARLTRAENEDISLESRGKKAAGFDLFISEHSNAGGGKGVECYYSVKRASDALHAARLAESAADAMSSPNRGAKTRPGSGGNDYYGVIRSAAAVNATHIFLIENGFHDNPDDEAFLLLPENLKSLAKAQAKVICEILGVDFKENSPHFAEESWTNLNLNGIIAHEKRFDDPATRGEVFVLLNQVLKRL